MLLFTGTAIYLTIRFPQFMGLRIMTIVMVLLNALFFIRFSEKKKGLFDRIMQSRFFPRKLAFTREGKFLVLITMGMGFAAVNTGSNLLYLLMAMLLALIVGSGILSELVLRKLSWEVEIAGEAVARTETLVPIRIHNKKRRLNSFSLEGELLLEDEPEPLQHKGRILKLSAGDRDFLFPRITFPGRGEYSCRGIAIGTRYPFSFFTKSRNFEMQRKIVVVPKGDHRVDPAIASLATGFEEHANRSGRGSEFFSVRPMHSGDEWRDVHWKQTAKTSKFTVKEYEALTARRTRLVLALDPGVEFPHEEAREQGIEIAASIVRFLALNRFDVGLSAPGIHVNPLSGISAVRHIFRALALLDVDPQIADHGADPSRDGPLVAGQTGREVVITVNLDSHMVDIVGDSTQRPVRFHAGEVAA